MNLKLKLSCDRRSVGQSVLVSGSRPYFCFLCDNCGFLDVGRPLRREDVSVIYSYNCFWALPEQSLSGPIPQNSLPYFTVSCETPPTWRSSSPYLYSPGTWWPSYTHLHWVPFCRLIRQSQSHITTRWSTVELF
jgi:hypothetical protein